MAMIEGYLFGLAMVVFIGPVFFTLLRSTLQYGTKAGLLVVFGIFISDLLIALLCSISSAFLFESKQFQFWIALSSSTILFFLGFKYLLKPNVNSEVKFKHPLFHLSTFFAKGFIVNFLNPFVFVIWITTIAYAKTKFVNENNSLFFILSVLLGVLTTDSLKVIIARKIQKFLKPELLRKIYFGSGIVLICFGVRLLVFVFEL
jgi:threonine/homoserine/homoserine lactone efflux protein